jgi:adhesin transport system outer membrane protein
MRPIRSLIAVAVVVLCQSQPLRAQQTGVAADPLRHAVEKALKTSPDVTARFNAYRAASDAVDAARGGLLPRLDLNASVGVDRDRITSRLPQNETLNRRGAALTLTQLLWDGLGTQR